MLSMLMNIKTNIKRYLIHSSNPVFVKRTLIISRHLQVHQHKQFMGTYLIKPQVIFIPVRFVGEKPVAACIGNACESFVARVSNSSAPTSTVTTTAPSPETSNAAANLLDNPGLPNATLPSTNITQEGPSIPSIIVQQQTTPSVPNTTVSDALSGLSPAIQRGKVQSLSLPKNNNSSQEYFSTDNTFQDQPIEKEKPSKELVNTTDHNAWTSQKDIGVDFTKPEFQKSKKIVIESSSQIVGNAKVIKNINKNKSTWLEEMPPREKQNEKPVRKKAFGSNESDIETTTESATSSSPEIIVGTLTAHPDTENLDYIQKHPVFATENSTTHKLEVFAYATSNKGLTEVSGSRSDGYTTHLDQRKIDGTFKPLKIDSHSRTVTDDYGTRVLSPIPVEKIIANDSYGDFIPTKEIEGQFAMTVLPPKEVDPGDFILNVEATAYANQPHVKAKLEAIKNHTDNFQATPYRPSDYLNEDTNNLPKEESPTPVQNETLEQVD